MDIRSTNNHTFIFFGFADDQNKQIHNPSSIQKDKYFSGCLLNSKLSEIFLIPRETVIVIG